MPLHTVTKHDKTKNGKPTVYFDNKHSFDDAVFLGNTAPPPIGALIDTEMTSMTGRNGKPMWFLNKWGMAPANAQPATYAIPPPVATAPPQDHWKPNTAIPVNAAPSGPEPQKASPVSYSDGERLFMSNIVAAAIGAGKIQDPVDLIAWTQAALQALRNCVEQSF